MTCVTLSNVKSWPVIILPLGHVRSHKKKYFQSYDGYWIQANRQNNIYDCIRHALSSDRYLFI